MSCWPVLMKWTNNMENNTSNVNYDELRLDPQGPSDPYDDALAFRSLLGAVHNEFNTIVNNNITGASSSLHRIDARPILEKGVKELISKQPPAPLPIEIPEKHNQTETVNNSNNIFVPLAEVVPPPAPAEWCKKDDDQLEFNFDNTATAQKIYDALENIDIKIDTIESKLDKILNALESVNIKKKRVPSQPKTTNTKKK